MIAVMNRAAMCAKSVAAWKIIVLPTSIERAEQVGRRSGFEDDVKRLGGPRRKQSGSGDCAQTLSNEPNAMIVVAAPRKETGYVVEYVES